MILTVNIPKSGFVPGETVDVNGSVSNASSAKPEEVRIMLRQIIHYHSQTPHAKTKEEIIDLVEKRSPADPRMEMIKFQDMLILPPLPPSLTTSCRVVNISYEVYVEVKIRGVYLNPHLRIPITIGTYPLVNYYQQPTAPLPNIVTNMHTEYQSTINQGDFAPGITQQPPIGFMGAVHKTRNEDMRKLIIILLYERIGKFIYYTYFSTTILRTSCNKG